MSSDLDLHNSTLRLKIDLGKAYIRSVSRITPLSLRLEGPSSRDASLLGRRMIRGSGCPTARMRWSIASRWGVALTGLLVGPT